MAEETSFEERVDRAIRVACRTCGKPPGEDCEMANVVFEVHATRRFDASLRDRNLFCCEGCREELIERQAEGVVWAHRQVTYSRRRGRCLVCKGYIVPRRHSKR